MKRATLGIVVVLLVIAGNRTAPRAQSGAAPSLVGTWLLTSEQMRADSATPTNAQGARGMLIMDGAGHYFELVDRNVPAALATGLSEAQLRFYRMSGTWGRYEADRAAGRITFEAFAGRSVNQTGAKFSRTFTVAPVQDDQDLLTTTSQAGELHTLGITRRTWQRVPTMMGFPQEIHGVMGFWRHEVEGQKRADNGEKLSEVTRDPSVIVYTPAGFVGVHFPTRTRTKFAAGEPTDAEARQDGNYLGYYAALGLYPGGKHQGLIFHNILGGSMTPGSTLRRFFDLEGQVVHLTFPPTMGRQGVRSSTYVNLRRLSDVNAMLGR
jgi:hypothetical protein